MERFFITATLMVVLATTSIPNYLGSLIDGNSGGYRYEANASTIDRRLSCFTRSWDGTTDCL
jgi:hypothetical protein